MTETADRAHVWEEFLTQRDGEFFKKTTRYGGSKGFGKRPAILLIDMQYYITGDEDKPLLEMIEKWPAACGHEAWETIPRQQAVLSEARAVGVPVIYTRFIPKQVEFDPFDAKHQGPTPVRIDPNEKQWQIIAELAPREGEPVLDKFFSSALFATPLISWLVALGVDTVIVMGTSTSGCVRATAVDLSSYNFHVALVEDGVFDRLQLAHAATLLDMHMKYTDVVWHEEVLSYLRSLPAAD